ncbi:ribbon-helix-helix protein, CopG family [Mycobacterium sp. HUMS_1102779]|uniref:ribbon-helix-helix protein, CopG family n=1 Tax=Mycobacterium sp. HUMS_1102779 TaxID=3383487 RepID=UPI00389A6A89
MAKRSAKDYAEMSRAVESGDYTVAGPLEMGSTLRMGRPVGESRRGSSPTRTIRLPAELNKRLDAYVSAEHTTPSEVMRHALDEYLGRIGA